VLLINPCFPEVTERWFDPLSWADRAKPVTGGGRGSAWFISLENLDVVLRHYRRGGIVAKLSTNRYLYTGEQRVRSFSEFRLLNELYRGGLPVPRPVAAWYQRSGMVYEAAIIIERIVGSQTFGEIWRDCTSETWALIGETVRQFHEAGVYHADLNCFNILICNDKIYLIDFDKSRVRGGPKGASWMQSNLERLQRSLQREVASDADNEILLERWSYLVSGYNKT
jgi:3-deoxy-D-manno-octulosonic acid kinase